MKSKLIWLNNRLRSRNILRGENRVRRPHVRTLTLYRHATRVPFRTFLPIVSTLVRQKKINIKTFSLIVAFTNRLVPKALPD